MVGNVRDFRDLIVWQKAIVFAKEVYLVSRMFPTDERFGLTAQIRRAAVSVSSNIAEGHERRGKEFAHFLSIARGSLAEVESQLMLAVELEFIREADTVSARELAVEIRKMAIAICKKLRSDS